MEAIVWSGNNTGTRLTRGQVVYLTFRSKNVLNVPLDNILRQQ